MRYLLTSLGVSGRICTAMYIVVLLQSWVNLGQGSFTQELILTQKGDTVFFARYTQLITV
jgi:hypothetical protein